MNLDLLTPQHWKDYELIDCGNFSKLERFGKYVLIRPEPQAVWDKRYSEAEWKKMAHAEFEQKSSHSGKWKKLKDIPDNWQIGYRHKLAINFKLALTGFKHVGVFPEQAANWDFIYKSLKEMKGEQPRMLNLFAYTGGASLAGKSANADVVHVDSIKQVVSWARDNMDLSELKDIRWVVEDASLFVQREVKRGKKYQGIILDPPAYGIGSSGERWKLEEHINGMLQDLSKLLDPQKHFFIINVYSLGFSALILENLVRFNFPYVENIELGELYLDARSGVKLPLGVYARFAKY